MLQPSKAPSPILVTLLGIVIEVKEEQPSKALFPMLVTLLGMVMEVREEHSKKAQSQIDVNAGGRVTDLINAGLIFFHG